MSVTRDQLLMLQDSRKLREELNLVVRWRVLTMKGGKARIVAYQDARDVQKVLDHICGPENWENEPMNLNGKMYMQISIKTEDGWIKRTDVGTETAIESVKGEASDAFKRAAVLFGIFRDIYELDYIVLNVDRDGKTPLTNEGKRLETPDAITLYCNGMSNSMGYLRRLYESMKPIVNEELMSAFSTLKKYCK